MPEGHKGRSPFYPGQPVPVELFTGRTEQIRYMMERGVSQVESGKPVAMYVQGEYGIGKSSFASYVQRLAEGQGNLHCINVSLGGTKDMDDVGAAILRGAVESGALNPTRAEQVREWLAKYIGEQPLFGVATIHAEALKEDAPKIAAGTLPFLREVIERLKDTHVQGVFLVLDEINGIASNPDFAHFIKGLVDRNALSREPVPLLLALCGVEECRRNMIRLHEPVDRIFDIVEIERMTDEEMREFFHKAFESARIRVDEDAMDVMVRYSAGFPKIVHIVGDEAYWKNEDGIIDENAAAIAVIRAARQVGTKYVDQQVYRALRSEDYRSILNKIGAEFPTTMRFRKSEIAANLTESEKKKLDNFLQKMKKLKVLRRGEGQGEYIFNSRMVRLYIWLNSEEKSHL